MGSAGSARTCHDRLSGKVKGNDYSILVPSLLEGMKAQQYVKFKVLSYRFTFLLITLFSSLDLSSGRVGNRRYECAFAN